MLREEATEMILEAKKEKELTFEAIAWKVSVDGFELSGGYLLGGEPFGGYACLGTLYILALEDLSPLAEA